MKKIALSLLVTVLAGSVLAAKPTKVEDFKVEVSKSKVTWLAKKVTGEHSGIVALSSGTLAVANGSITGGSFTINMSSIECSDLEGEWKDKLVGHLKSDDFFSVSKNPTSKFDITNIAKKDEVTTVTGNLTIKGITHSISFPASISQKGNVIVAIAKIKIDRTKFDIKYGSKSFIEGIGDKAIDDEFELQVNLVAMK
jgi:polyisoprenoid-binding protein YceI